MTSRTYSIMVETSLAESSPIEELLDLCNLSDLEQVFKSNGIRSVGDLQDLAAHNLTEFGMRDYQV